MKFYTLNYESLNDLNELLHNKNGRKYYHSIRIDDDFFAIVPLRSALMHRYGIKTVNGFGMDLHKALFLTQEDFERCVVAEVLISNKEYNALYRKKHLFKEKLIDCIETFLHAKSLPENKRENHEKNLLIYSTFNNYSDQLESILSKLKD